MKTRVRIGIRARIFPNAGIFVIYLPWATFTAIEERVTEIKEMLREQKMEELAARFVFEAAE